MPDAKRYPLGLVIEEDASKASVLIGLLEEVGMDIVRHSPSTEGAASYLADKGLRMVLIGSKQGSERITDRYPMLMRGFSIFLVSERPNDVLSHCPAGFDGTVPVGGPSSEIRKESIRMLRSAAKDRDALAVMLERYGNLCSIVDSTYDVVFTLDDEQRYTGVYGARLNNLEDGRDGFIGRTPREVWGEEAGKIHEEHNLKALRGEFVSYEWETYTDQGVRHFMTSLSPIMTDDVVRGVAGITHDITDRVAAEDALRRSEESFRTLLEFSPFSVIVHDMGTMEVVYANSNAIAQSGFLSLEEMRAHGVEWADPPYSAIDARMKALAAIEDGPQRFQWLSASKDGPHYWEQISLMVLPFRGEDRILAVSVNIDDLKRLEMSLRLTNEKIQLLSSLIRHDVMNKITALRGFTELAIDSCDCGTFELLRRVEQAAIAIQSDIDFMREYDRLGKDDPQWQRVRFSVSSATMKGVEVEMLLSGLEVYADPMFNHVFENLLDNSIRHGGKLSRIRVSAHQEGEHLTINWDDDGIGIPVEDKERIFNRGFGRNTGFGLFLSRHILSLTGMDVREEGEERCGARFVIRVPKDMWRWND